MKSAREHIEALFRLRACNDPNSVTLANTLSKDIQTSFVGQHKFIFELLQNADDASISQQNVEVTITLFDGYLIFSHCGQHFSKDDVDRLCDNAQQKHIGKVCDIDKTGYKGIGFKSVFSLSDCVYVQSQDYFFRFDKNYHQWIEAPSDQPYPWPLIPIWTEEKEIPDDLKPYLDRERVNFIIQLKEATAIQNELQFFENNPRLILFLRRIQTIQFHILQGQEKKQFSVRTENVGDVRRLFVNRTLNSSWLLSHWQIEIPEDVRENLQRMSDFECPVKLKTTNQIVISFAGELNERNQLIGARDALLYCYLPTQINCGLPYLVNTDFLLNADRSGLLDNEWNAFLLRQIVYHHFLWLKQLAQNPTLRDQVLLLLSPYRIYSPYSRLASAYSAGFSTGKEEIAFVPSYVDSNRLLKISESIVDQTGFFREFPEIVDNQYPRDQIVRYELAQTNRLINQGARVFNDVVFYQRIGQYSEQLTTPEDHCRFLRFLSVHELIERREALRENPFVLSSSNRLVKPNSLYFQTKNIGPLEGIVKLNFVHPVLQNDEIVRNFLIQLGIRTANQMAVITKELVPLLCSSTLSNEHNITAVRFIFDVYASKNVYECGFLTALINIRVVTLASQKRGVKNCYCSVIAALDQQPPVELIPDNSIFISRDYIRPNDSLQQWQEFFLAISARSFIEGFIEQLIAVNDAWLLSHTVECMRFLFSMHQLNLLREEDYTKLKSVRVLTQEKTLRKCSRCYLSNAYQPKSRLETMVNGQEHLFVSDHYIDSTDEQQCWRDFFLRIGVHESLYLQYRKEYWYREALENNDQRFLTYYCVAYNLLDTRYPEEDKKRDYVLKEFIDCDFLPFMDVKEIYDAFWKLFLRVWDKIPKQSEWFGKKTEVIYKSRRRKRYTMIEQVQLRLESPLQYGLRAYPCICGTDDRLYRAGDLYAPQLKEIVDGVFTVAAVPLTLEQSRWLGLKTEISFQDCFVILKALMVILPEQAFKRYEFVLKRLLEFNVGGDIQPVTLLLADNNSWQQSRSLYFFDAEIRLSSPIWLKPVLSSQEMKRLCRLFSIPIITAGQERILYTPISENENCINNCRIHIKRNLAVLAFIMSHQSLSITTESILNPLFDQLACLQCIPTQNMLEIEWVPNHPDSIQRVGAYIKGNLFYFVKDWSNSANAKRAMGELLSKYLQLAQPESETFKMLIGMNWKDVTEWLQYTKRYGDKELQALEVFIQFVGVDTGFNKIESFPNLSEESVVDVKEQPYQSQIDEEGFFEDSVTVGEDGNDTFVDPLTLDMSKITLSSTEKRYSDQKPEKLNSSGIKLVATQPSITIFKTNQTKPKQALKPFVSIDTSAVGRWGELAVYEKLKQHFRDQCETCQLTDIENGCRLSGTSKRGVQLEVEIIWLNKTGEQGEPIDFIVRKNSTEKFIEVKSTTHSGRTQFKLSGNEYKYMLEKGQQHRVFFLYHAGKEEGVHIKKIKNLGGQIQAGEIIPHSISVTM